MGVLNEYFEDLILSLFDSNWYYLAELGIWNVDYESLFCSVRIHWQATIMIDFSLVV